MTQDEKDLARFTWNDQVGPEDIEAMKSLRQAGKDLCELIQQLCPACPDRSAAIRDLRVAIMQANISIAHRKLNDGN